MICKQCGAQLGEGSKFCTKCGCAIENQDTIQAVAAEAPAEKKKKEKKVKKENKFVKTLLSVLCCIMIFVLSFATLTLFTVRDSISPEKVESLLDNADIQMLVENSGMNNLIGGMDGKDIERVYRKTSIKDYVEDIAKDYTDYLLGGKKPKGVKADDVVDLLYENQYEIEEILGEGLSDRDFEQTYEFFEEDGAQNLGVLSSEVRTNDVLDTTRIIISIYVVIALLALTALFIFLLFKARRYNLNSLVWTSVPLILTSILFGVFASVKPIVLSFLNGLEPIVSEVAALFMSNILGVVLLNSGLVLLTGILLIAAFVITKKIKKSVADKKAVIEA